MRLASFRDDVLWAIAHKAGVDPDVTRNGQGIMPDQADAWVSFINAWVRRLYPSADFPEWTETNRFAVDASHIVPWNAVAIDTGVNVRLDTVLKVYLLDPALTWAPVDTPFRLRPRGVHVGFEHGSSVWIKYLAPAPRFTAREWVSTALYSAEQIVYSPFAGQCFKSKTSGNKGHDPQFTFSQAPGQTPQPPIPLQTEITTPLSLDNPGMSTQNQIVDITFTSGGSSLSDIPNPPPLNARFFVEVVDEDGALVGDATSMANGTDTLDLIVTDLSNQLISALTGFVGVTVDTNTFTIRIEDDSNFRVNQAFWGRFSEPNRNVPVRQVQSYLVTTTPGTGTNQVIELPLTDDQVTPGTTYTLDFKDVAGGSHVVNYVSLESDNAEHVLAALIAGVQSSAGSDPFFGDVVSELDSTSIVASFATETAISLDAQMLLPGSAWWELVPFHMDLVEPVVRGAYADWLKAEGQTDKGMPEEEAVKGEAGMVTGRMLAPQYDPLTDQQRGR